MNNKGFTLVELMAVFLLLGIISVIMYQSTNTGREAAKKEKVEASAIIILKAANQYDLDKQYDSDYTGFPEDGLDITELDNISNVDFQSGKVIKNNGIFVLVDLTDGNYCVNGTTKKLEIVKGDCTD